MKHCPTCDRYYRDGEDRCPRDGSVLNDVDPIFTFQSFESPGKRPRTDEPANRSMQANTDEIPASGRTPASREGEAPRGVDAPIPPHDDWEAWNAWLGERPAVDRQPSGRTPARRRTDHVVAELVAAAFGFAMFGFLLHVITTPRPHRNAVAAVGPSTPPAAAASPPAVPVTVGRAASPTLIAGSGPNSVPSVSVDAGRSSAPPRMAEVRQASVDRRRAVATRAAGETVGLALSYAAQAFLPHPSDRVAARGDSPVVRHIARPRGIPQQALRPSPPPGDRVAFRGIAGRTAATRSPRSRTRVAQGQSTTSPARARVASAVEEKRFHATDPDVERVETAPGGVPPAQPASPNSDEDVIALSASLDRRSTGSDSSKGPFGISGPVGDRHVVYVVEASSRMAARWPRAVGEIGRAIQSMGENDTFDIVTFNSRAHAFSSTLMPSMPGTAAPVIDYLRYVRPSGPANLREALWLAMQLPDVNEIVVVADGSPTGGETDLRRLAGFTASENRNHIRIDTVALVDGVSGAGSMDAVLTRIARDSGGQSRSIVLE